MTDYSNSDKLELTLENIKKIAPESTGTIILYDENGNMNKLLIDENDIKIKLSKILEEKTSSFFFIPGD